MSLSKSLPPSLRASALAALATFGLCAFTSQSARAIDIDAGDYTALPAGTNVVALYGQHAQRDSLYAKGDQVPGRYGLDSTIGVLRVIHFTKIGDYIVDPQILLPFGELRAKDDVASLGKGSGVADAILAATVWTINDPANRRYLGITPFLYVPIGNYDRSKALNLGENRWKYALQVGYIQGISEKFTVDLSADVTAYGKNSRANPAGQTLAQNQSYQLQAFLRYDLRPGIDLRAGLSRGHSGNTKLDGVSQDTGNRVDKFQLGTGAFVTPTTQVLALWGKDLKVTNGFKENNRFNLRLLQVF